MGLYKICPESCPTTEKCCPDVANISVKIIFVGLSYQGKDIVFRFILEYSSLSHFGP
jgi:hypothetical protein